MRFFAIASALLVLGPMGFLAHAQNRPPDETLPVYEMENGNEVVVVPPEGPPPPDRGGTLTVIVNNTAPSRQTHFYYGPHPDGRGGWDPTEGAHAHDEPPFDPFLFASEHGYYYFIGDPYDFGYGGTLYPYQGYHPIATIYGGGYCYMGGPHRHHFTPYGTLFHWQNGYYLYQGPFAPSFYQHRARYDRYYRNVYPRRVVGHPTRGRVATPPPAHFRGRGPQPVATPPQIAPGSPAPPPQAAHVPQIYTPRPAMPPGGGPIAPPRPQVLPGRAAPLAAPLPAAPRPAAPPPTQVPMGAPILQPAAPPPAVGPIAPGGSSTQRRRHLVPSP